MAIPLVASLHGQARASKAYCSTTILKPHHSPSFFSSSSFSSSSSVKPSKGLKRAASLVSSGLGALTNGSSEREEKLCVNWFRSASPYIRGIQGGTFVVVIPAAVVDTPSMQGILQDISLLHGLGIKLVIVPGIHLQIDRLLKQRGHMPQYEGAYQITDRFALEAAMEAAGKICFLIESKLSPGPPISILRRHGENNRWHVGVSIASGNFLAAKRRGVVNGVDFHSTGEVKRIDVGRIKERLDSNCIVIMSNLGYSNSGEVLNCNTYEVATACATALQADKLICMLDGPLLDDNGKVIQFMTLRDADQLIRKRANQSEVASNYIHAVASNGFIKTATSKSNGNVNGSINVSSRCNKGFGIGGEERFSRINGYLSEMIAAVYACREGGVRRVHLLDSTIEGAMLLELYTRDGVGTMIASDTYEGTRSAKINDIPRIKELIQPLEESGALLKLSIEGLIQDVDCFNVVERDGSIIACAALFPFYQHKSGEVAAFFVSPECCGHGQGDNLLDYVEWKAIKMGLKKLFLLTTRAADWFERRGFTQCSITSIPERRRITIDLSRGSKYYMKLLTCPHNSSYSNPNNVSHQNQHGLEYDTHSESKPSNASHQTQHIAGNFKCKC